MTLKSTNSIHLQRPQNSGAHFAKERKNMESLYKKNSEYFVIKSNDLVQKNRYELSLQEQKIVAFICTLLKPGSIETKYQINIREFCKLCDINYDSGKNYAEIKKTLQKLSNKSMWLEMTDGCESLCRWLSKVRVYKNSSIAHIELDPDMIPYLFELKSNFTKYQLIQVINMKSAFSIRMYELMKCNAFKKKLDIKTEELKKKLMVENIKSYNNFKDFRKKVLEISIKEINELTDLKIFYETHKTGNKITNLTFRIQEKY